jgi:hypothetical protein
VPNFGVRRSAVALVMGSPAVTKRRQAVALQSEGTKLYLTGLDAINDTPVIDIKPVMIEFPPREDVRQPTWATELMGNYWHKRSEQLDSAT